MNYAGEKGGMSFEYRSNMNVPSQVVIKNPNGQIVFEKSYPYMYKSLRDHTTLKDPINGPYTLEVTQDGIMTSTKVEVTVFKE